MATASYRGRSGHLKRLCRVGEERIRQVLLCLIMAVYRQSVSFSCRRREQGQTEGGGAKRSRCQLMAKLRHRGRGQADPERWRLRASLCVGAIAERTNSLMARADGRTIIYSTVISSGSRSFPPVLDPRRLVAGRCSPLARLIVQNHSPHVLTSCAAVRRLFLFSFPSSR